MTLDIIMLQNIFLLHTKMQLSSRISQFAILKYRYVNIVHFKKLLMLMKSIMLTIRGRDTLRPLGI